MADHLQKQLERLYEEFEVDIVFTGHVHAYARTCNVFEGKCISPKDGGMTHVTIGALARPGICYQTKVSTDMDTFILLDLARPQEELQLFLLVYHWTSAYNLNLTVPTEKQKAVLGGRLSVPVLAE